MTDEVPRAEFEVIKTQVDSVCARLSLRRPSAATFPLRVGQMVALQTVDPIINAVSFQIIDVGEGWVELADDSASLWGVDVRRMVRLRQREDDDGTVMFSRDE